MQISALSQSLLLLRSSLALLVLLPLALSAQQEPLDDLSEPVEEAEALARYTVELIVFAYTDGAGASKELWLSNEQLRAEIPGTGANNEETGDARVTGSGSDAGTLQSSDDINARRMLANIISIEYPISLRKMAPSLYSMDKIYGRLARLDLYEPLMHVGWTQTVYAKNETLPIDLSALGKLPPGLDGTATLYLGRFLHLVMDLQLAADKPKNNDPSDVAVERSPLVVYGDNRVGSDLDNMALSAQDRSVHYRIFEDRKVRRKELHYFDHPKFGVIAKTTREEIVEPAIAAHDATGT